jgi:hypothetical protein
MTGRKAPVARRVNALATLPDHALFANRVAVAPTVRLAWGTATVTVGDALRALDRLPAMSVALPPLTASDETVD